MALKTILLDYSVYLELIFGAFSNLHALALSRLRSNPFALGRVAPFSSSGLSKLSFLAPLRNSATQNQDLRRPSTAKLVSFTLSCGFSGTHIF